MRSWRRVALALAIAAVTSPGCSDRTSRSFVFEPTPGRFALAGRVVLSGLCRDEVGTELGTRVLGSASGVRIHVLRPDGSVDSTLSRDGAFTFQVNDEGHYRAFCWVVAPDTVATADAVVVAGDTSFADTLRLGPAGEITTYPNPFPAEGPTPGLGIEFMPQAPQHVEVRMQNLAGQAVWTYEQDYPVTLFHVHWIGTDNHDDPVPDGSYWAVTRHDGGYHYNLTFKE